MHGEWSKDGRRYQSTNYIISDRFSVINIEAQELLYVKGTELVASISNKYFDLELRKRKNYLVVPA